MTRKINPISLRLGLFQVWDFTIQNYTKLDYYYVLSFFKQFQLNDIILKILKFNRFLISDKDFLYINHKLFLNIYVIDINSSLQNKYLLVISELSKSLSDWFSLKVYLRIYRKIDYMLTSNLVLNYAIYLIEQNQNFNKVLWLINQFILNHLNKVKVVYCTKGVRYVYLKGFKIQLVGRFSNTKNQMAKSIQQSFGSLSLISLKNYVEFSQKDLYTKLGSCGLRIWLFYEIK
uniref:Ribosomal protein S3 n=1 Tax=Hydropuntia rangiferina TaxID=338881 RepID=A0A345UBA7_9FLOR|nr:ribosomal protein S3 [Hydropuntia rangiferina]AXI97743.1 ribosomal protein S3 [Hydropuntia rangiferina]UAD89769.1 ribosomal protein S3 [Hydropuntia rangiferina]